MIFNEFRKITTPTSSQQLRGLAKRSKRSPGVTVYFFDRRNSRIFSCKLMFTRSHSKSFFLNKSSSSLSRKLTLPTQWPYGLSRVMSFVLSKTPCVAIKYPRVRGTGAKSWEDETTLGKATTTETIQLKERNCREWLHTLAVNNHFITL